MCPCLTRAPRPVLGYGRLDLLLSLEVRAPAITTGTWQCAWRGRALTATSVPTSPLVTCMTLWCRSLALAPPHGTVATLFSSNPGSEDGNIALQMFIIDISLLYQFFVRIICVTNRCVSHEPLVAHTTPHNHTRTKLARLNFLPMVRARRWPTDGSPVTEPQGNTTATPRPDARRIDNQRRQRRSWDTAGLASHQAWRGTSRVSGF